MHLLAGRRYRCLPLYNLPLNHLWHPEFLQDVLGVEHALDHWLVRFEELVESEASDGGHLILSGEKRAELLAKRPELDEVSNPSLSA